MQAPETSGSALEGMPTRRLAAAPPHWGLQSVRQCTQLPREGLPPPRPPPGCSAGTRGGSQRHRGQSSSAPHLAPREHAVQSRAAHRVLTAFPGQRQRRRQRPLSPEPCAPSTADRTRALGLRQNPAGTLTTGRTRGTGKGRFNPVPTGLLAERLEQPLWETTAHQPDNYTVIKVTGTAGAVA